MVAQWLYGEESPGQGRGRGFDSCVGKSSLEKFLHSCLGNPMDRAVWQATVRGVAEESGATQHKTWQLTTTANMFWDFPGDPEVKNLPISAEDLGSIPGPGRSHLSWGNSASAAPLLSRQAAIKTQHSKKKKKSIYIYIYIYVYTHTPICSYMEQYQRYQQSKVQNSIIVCYHLYQTPER